MAMKTTKNQTSCMKGPPTLLGWPIGFGVMLLAFTGVALAGGGGSGGGGVPEIDAGSALSALAVLGGGLLLVTDRLRKRRSSR
jgi:hypothetical protein